MNRRFATLAAMAMTVAAALATAGCDPGTGLQPGAAVERTSSALMYFAPFPRFTMAVDLVGRGLNGMSLNGKILDGRFVTAVSLHDARLPKGGHRDLKLAATSFTGGHSTVDKARRLFVGTTFTARLDDGDTVSLRVDAVEEAPDPANPYLRYAVSYPSDGTWRPLCGTDDSGMPVLAIPLEGLWDYRQGEPGGGSWSDERSAFTLACEGFVLAKCVAMGYAPWVEGRMCTGTGKKQQCDRTTLADHHQACARMLRADFCGDGSSFTSDGLWVNAYDGIGIRYDSEDWPLEAEWDDRGARCASHQRLRDAGIEPPCMAALALADCGTPQRFEAGTLIMSESEPGELP